MVTYNKFIKRANQLNVVVEDDGQVLSIEAPKGKVFGTYFTHADMIFYGYDNWTKPQAYERMIEIMAMGLVDCDIEDCETCKTETNEN